MGLFVFYLFLDLFMFLCMSLYMSANHVHACPPRDTGKRGLDFLELELQKVVSHPVGAGN